MSTSLVQAPFTLIDGGLSTALEQLGHRPAGMLWTAQLLIDQPEQIVAAHRLYVDAGADVIITSSYQASVAGFVEAGQTPAHGRVALASTTSLARQSGAPVVAASVGPYGAVLGDGSEYHGRYPATWAEIAAFHRERLEVLVDSGPDLLAIETIPSATEAAIIVDIAHDLSALPMWVSFSCRDKSHTSAGDPLESAAAMIAHDNLVAIGVNCTAPQNIEPLLRALPDHVAGLAYPNHGGVWDPVAEGWSVDVDQPGVDVYLQRWIDAGAKFIGGCCGVGPDGIAALSVCRTMARGY